MKEEKNENIEPEVLDTQENDKMKLNEVPVEQKTNETPAAVAPTQIQNTTSLQAKQNIGSSQNPVPTPEVKESPKSNFTIFIIFGIMILFVIALPFITSYIEGNDAQPVIDNQIKDTKEYNTHNGMIKIGEDSYLELFNIKFYNFNRNVNNQIKYNIISSKKITNPKEIGIYISLYNSGESLIYRGYFNFDKTLEKSVVNSDFITLDNDVYLQASYAKIHKEIKEEVPSNLKCNKSLTDTKEEVTFNFVNDLLMSYEYTKSLLFTGSEGSLTNNTIIEEYNNLQNNNLTDLTLNDNSYSYKVNLETDTSSIKKLSNYNTAKIIVNNRLTSEGWTCE